MHSTFLVGIFLDAGASFLPQTSWVSEARHNYPDNERKSSRGGRHEEAGRDWRNYLGEVKPVMAIETDTTRIFHLHLFNKSINLLLTNRQCRQQENLILD